MRISKALSGHGDGIAVRDWFQTFSAQAAPSSQVSESIFPQVEVLFLDVLGHFRSV
jgi:hypothetical protein